MTALTCDLTAFGGEVVSAKGPAENLTVSSGTAKVPQGKDITCQVDLTGVVGRNRGQGRTHHRQPDLLQRLHQGPPHQRGEGPAH